MQKEKQLLRQSGFLFLIYQHVLINLKEWLNWPHMLGIANKCAQQLVIRTAVLLWSDALPGSYGNSCTSSSDTLLAEPADGGLECEGWTEQLWVSATAQPSLLCPFSLSKVYKVFPPSYITKPYSLLFFIDCNASSMALGMAVSICRLVRYF